MKKIKINKKDVSLKEHLEFLKNYSTDNKVNLSEKLLEDIKPSIFYYTH